MSTLPTACITRKENQWIDRLYAAFRARTAERIRLAGDLVTGHWHLDSERGCFAAYEELSATLLGLTWVDRDRVLADIAAQLAPHSEAPRLMLSWDEVRTLRATYPAVEIGGHTANHIDLRGGESDLIGEEVSRCRKDLQRELGIAAQHFSFPYARSCSRSRAIIRESGFRSAVAADDVVRVRPEVDRHQLPRVESPAARSLFRLWSGGVPPSVPQRLVANMWHARRKRAEADG